MQEYSYRKIFKLTHEEYEREPTGVIEWLLRIEAVHEKVRRRLEERAARRG